MKVAAIIPARMGSKRYPGKVLETISNHPVIYHVIERIRDSQAIDVIVVATTTDPDDKILLKRAREFQVHGYAGPENDLIKRFLSAAEIVGADIIVRIECGNPLFEPSFIDDSLALLQKEKADFCFVEDAMPGTGVDAFTKEALKIANEKAKEKCHREDFISFFKENKDLKAVSFRAHDRFKLPTLNLAFDTKEDLRLIRALYHKFYQEDTIIPLVKVISYLKQHPEIADLNADIIRADAEERERAAKAKAEADAIAMAEKAAAKAKEAAEKAALDAKKRREEPEFDIIEDKKDIFTLERRPTDEEKKVSWEDIFPDHAETKEEEEDLDLKKLLEDDKKEEKSSEDEVKEEGSSENPEKE
jgi:spore coat polysaccharide biosynthesis protein SpsF